MKKRTAERLFEMAHAHISEMDPEGLAWALKRGDRRFAGITSRAFVGEYCWVVYASGFKVSILEVKFSKLEHAFKDFDLASISRMRSVSAALKVINHDTKARCFLEGCKSIAQEGFRNFKHRLEVCGLCPLEALPGIGPITKYHLAKNIGLQDTAKPDIWLERAASLCSTSVNGLVEYLSHEYRMSRHAVDLVLWKYGADERFGPFKSQIRTSGRQK